MASVMLKLEDFTGREIEQVISDACGVARRCGCWAKIKINNVEVLISPNDEPRWLLVNYHKAAERGATFVSANIVPNPPKEENRG